MIVITVTGEYKGKTLSKRFTEDEVAFGSSKSEKEFIYDVYRHIKEELYKATK